MRSGRHKTKQRRPAAFNPIKQAREREKLKSAKQKRRERERKQAATRKAELIKSKQLEMLATEYTKYISALQNELNDSNISVTRYNQITKEILRAQEKICKVGNDANKALFNSQV